MSVGFDSTVLRDMNCIQKKGTSLKIASYSLLLYTVPYIKFLF
jgi:hypothetical protein